MQKILILRFSSIGDIVLTTPVIRALKRQLDNAEIHYCTKQSFRSIIEYNPYVDKAHYLGESLNDLIAELNKEKFDFVVDLHNNLRTRLIKTRLARPNGTFDKLNFRKWLLVNLKYNAMPDVHIVERYLAAAKKLGISNDGEGLDYFIPEKDEVQMSSLPETHQNGYYGMAIGAQHYTKRLPVEKLIELCEKINAPIMLLGGKEDFETGELIAKHFKNQNPNNEQRKTNNENPTTNNQQRTTIFNSCGKYNLNQSASLVKQCKALFTHDTGLMHIGAAFQKKIYSIWGNTVPEFGMYPYKTDFGVFEVRGLDCRPCSKIGYSKCPRGHFKCMREQSFNFTLPA
ncbi:glycosyltransferase family 9 protein [Adhaeribacter sp. BT258]|uniref:Glycosyltransferase family 9 protein n=1 Tax=Adhaeribacter terrigena TaxID=2793070 RepID=A0ABS1C492_9BACT|nr:glycosyltransferase family 9 protein [Adhaeribacter terrigena]MBK0404138.1 glycosyltransferase family 9 protein [Adhaeribacter terrigena]